MKEEKYCLFDRFIKRIWSLLLASLHALELANPSSDTIR